MQPRRSLPLDVLRCVAVLLVLFHHSNAKWLSSLPMPMWLARSFQRGGWMGVDLFFVLSGFLIAGLLFREHQRRPGQDDRQQKNPQHQFYHECLHPAYCGLHPL